MTTRIDPELCFVLMPMKDEFIELYEDLVKPTVEKAGLKCEYAGDILGPGIIMEDIWDRVERARLIIADLTGRNANVFYEVGYAHALDRHKVILLSQDVEDVPFDLQGFRCIRYRLGPRGPKELGEKLTGTVGAVLAEAPESRGAEVGVADAATVEQSPPRVASESALALQEAVESAVAGSVPLSREQSALILDLLDKVDSSEARLNLVVTAFWEDLVTAVQGKNMHGAAILRDCKPVRVEGDTLILNARSSFHRDKLSEGRAKLLVEGELKRLTNSLRSISMRYSPSEDRRS
jgi:hypothetical protein